MDGLLHKYEHIYTRDTEQSQTEEQTRLPRLWGSIQIDKMNFAICGNI